MRRTWIKLYVNQTLRESTFKELSPDERFVWFGFLLLAADSPTDGGQIALGDDVGYTDSQLASILKCEVSLIVKAKKKLKTFEKIRVHKNGIIEIVNWKKYQSELKPKKEREKERRKKVVDGASSCVK